MAAPKHIPPNPVNLPRTYQSPKHVPGIWTNDRPGMVQESRDDRSHLGYQGPDQGYILLLARHASKQILIKEGETLPDAIAGTVSIALRRASTFGRSRDPRPNVCAYYLGMAH